MLGLLDDVLRTNGEDVPENLGFETAVFRYLGEDEEGDVIFDAGHPLHLRSYASREEALAGHDEVVKLVEAGLI